MNRPLKIGEAQLFNGVADELMPSPFGVCAACQVRKSSIVLYGMFVELARQFWSKSAGLVSKLPEHVRWDATNPGPLAIDAEYTFEEASAGKEPACLIGIKLGAITYTNPPGAGRDGFVKADPSTAQLEFSRLGTGTVIFSHVGTGEGQSLTMADETHDLLDAFSPVIRTDLDFTSFAVTQHTPVSERPRKWYGKERYVSEVVASFQFETRWVLIQEAPKLREIVFNAGQQAVERFIITGTKA